MPYIFLFKKYMRIMLKSTGYYKLQHTCMSYACGFFSSCCYYRYVLKCYYRYAPGCCSGYTNVGGRCERKHALFIKFSPINRWISQFDRKQYMHRYHQINYGIYCNIYMFNIHCNLHNKHCLTRHLKDLMNFVGFVFFFLGG